jgi:hypothetical protein
MVEIQNLLKRSAQSMSNLYRALHEYHNPPSAAAVYSGNPHVFFLKRHHLGSWVAKTV